MSPPSVEERLATLEANQNNMAADVTELKGDIKVVLATLSQARGGWKMLALLSSLAGIAGAFAAKLLTTFGGLRV